LQLYIVAFDSQGLRRPFSFLPAIEVNSAERAHRFSV